MLLSSIFFCFLTQYSGYLSTLKSGGEGLILGHEMTGLCLQLVNKMILRSTQLKIYSMEMQVIVIWQARI